MKYYDSMEFQARYDAATVGKPMTMGKHRSAKFRAGPRPSPGAAREKNDFGRKRLSASARSVGLEITQQTKVDSVP